MSDPHIQVSRQANLAVVEICRPQVRNAIGSRTLEELLAIFGRLHDDETVHGVLLCGRDDFAFGGQQLTEEIMRTYGLTLEEAGRAKKEGGLPSNYEPEILEPFIDDMTQQVSRSLQFFLASGTNREQPEQILVCGGCANIPGVAEVIASRVGIPTQVGNPLGTMKISSKARSQGVMKDATALLTACGLALRSFD